MDFFLYGILLTFFILINDKKLAEIEITMNICWFRYWAAYVRQWAACVGEWATFATVGKGPHKSFVHLIHEYRVILTVL